MGETRIGTLNLGGALDALDRLCLASMVAAGHPVTLYTYGTVTGVPEGVDTSAAESIHAVRGALPPKRSGAAAPIAMAFAYRLLARDPEVIWAAPDTCVLAPLRSESGHLHGWESEAHVSAGVLRLPQGGKTLSTLIDLTADPHALPPFLDRAERAQMHAAREAGTPMAIGDLPRSTWGSRALTHTLKATGDIRFTLPRAVLAPIPIRDHRNLLDPGSTDDPRITARTCALPLHAARLIRRLQDTGEPPHPDCRLGRLLDRHRVLFDPSAD